MRLVRMIDWICALGGRQRLDGEERRLRDMWLGVGIGKCARYVCLFLRSWVAWVLTHCNASEAGNVGGNVGEQCRGVR